MANLLLRIKKEFIKSSNARYAAKVGEEKGRWLPNLRRVEIELTSICNRGCYNCDRNCSQVPRKDVFSIKQMEKFVNESLTLGWQWDYIGLLGGEPTLSPDFFEKLEIIKRYVDKNPSCVVELVTNGFGPKVNSVIAKLPHWVTVRNSNKKSPVHLFDPYNVAPIDRGMPENSAFDKACKITTRCGIGLNCFGYYPCGAGASVDRIFGFNMGIKRLEDVSMRKLAKMLSTLCRYCGHFPVNEKPELVKEQKYSASWKQAIEQYQINSDKLTLY